MYEVKGRRGMLRWEVCTTENASKEGEGKNKKELKIHKNFEEGKVINHKVKETMFPLSP